MGVRPGVAINPETPVEALLPALAGDGCLVRETRADLGRRESWVEALTGVDVVIHLDRTHALEPLERTSAGDEGEPP